MGDGNGSHEFFYHLQTQTFACIFRAFAPQGSSSVASQVKVPTLEGALTVILPFFSVPVNTELKEEVSKS